jgi:hypothetical protein
MPPPKDETAEQREARLIKARKKASNVREEKMIEKYKNKVLEKVKTEKEEDEDDESDKDDKDEEAPDKLLKPVKVGGRPKRDEDEASASRPAREEPKEPKAPKKKQSKVIIEQSSDDEDVFEDKPNVIFVKRVRPKPKEPIRPSAPIQQQQQQQQPNQHQQQMPPQQFQQQQRPPPPQRPALTPEKRLEMQRYINMTQGNFLPVCRPR